jgi:hemolysin III
MPTRSSSRGRTKKKSVGGDDFGAEETSLLKSTRGEAEDTDDDEHERQEELNKYLENCAKFGVKVDPSVCVTLATGWSVLRLSKESSSEGSLLPLMGILEGNSRVKKLDLQSISMSDYRFRSAGNGNSNARVLSSILQENHSIEQLDLKGSGLDDEGLSQLCDVLKTNKGVKKLNLSSNSFSESGAKNLEDALSGNGTLQEVDLSNNSLGFEAISSLQCLCSPSGLMLKTEGNFVFEEVLNASTHGFGFLLSIVATVVLMNAVVEYENATDYHYWACLIYSVSLMFLFLFSTLFHSFFMMPMTSRIFQILDNIGIYMLIAGSYTPIMLVGLHDSYKARVMLIGEWSCAFVSSAFAVYCDLNHPTNQILKLMSFLFMGVACLAIMPELRTLLPADALWLLIAGGVCYIAGVVFFVKANQKPIFHVVWHLFVLAAAAIHWFGIYFYVIDMPINLQRNIEAVADEVRGNLQHVLEGIEATAHVASAALNDTLRGHGGDL